MLDGVLAPAKSTRPSISIYPQLHFAAWDRRSSPGSEASRKMRPSFMTDPHRGNFETHWRRGANLHSVCINIAEEKPRMRSPRRSRRGHAVFPDSGELGFLS
jgi:hypothetical protein